MINFEDFIELVAAIALIFSGVCIGTILFCGAVLLFKMAFGG